MRETEYSEAAVEVLDILNNTNPLEVKKIPQSFINFLKTIASKTYKINFKHSKSINQLDIKSQTKEILGFIYITWWCNEEEQKIYKKAMKENKAKKEELKEKYNIENIFKQRKHENIEQTNLIKYQEESKLKRIINKIFRFLFLKEMKKDD